MNLKFPFSSLKGLRSTSHTRFVKGACRKDILIQNKPVHQNETRVDSPGQDQATGTAIQLV